MITQNLRPNGSGADVLVGFQRGLSAKLENSDLPTFC
jgi:hypothetical protein